MTQAPRYQQVADALRRRIRSTEFAPDKPLPTEAELQEQYAVSRNTIREAVRLLLQQRLLEIRPGKGTFIAREFIPFVNTLATDLGSQGWDAEAGTPEVTVLKCPAHIAVRLRITEADRVVSRRQEHYIGGTAWSMQTSYYPLKWVTLGADGLLEPEVIHHGAAKYLETAIGLRLVGYRDLILARLPNDKEKTLFNLTHHDTVIGVYRTSFAEDETPIRVSATVFPADRNQIRYDVGTVPDRGEEPVRSPGA
jgi:GntR family transcriptional regulator